MMFSELSHAEPLLLFSNHSQEKSYPACIKNEVMWFRLFVYIVLKAQLGYL